MKKNLSKKKLRQLSCFRLAAVAIVVVCLLSLSLLGGMIFLRPGQSILERRVLTPFPEISWNTFWNGDYFKNISLWYSDTFPNRDNFVAMNQKVQDLYGIQSKAQVYRNNLSTREKESLEQGFDIREQAPETRQAALQEQILEGVMIQDQKAYEGFYFVEDAFDQYQNLMKNVADEMEGQSMVYSILIPTNAGIELSEEEYGQLGASDQKQSIDYYYSSLDERVIPIGTYDTLKAHQGEYLYYYSDHHWTPLAAYYVYENFCREKGWQPVDINSLQAYTFEPFLGSYAAEFGADTLQADTFTCWRPNETAQIQIYQSEEEYSLPEPVSAQVEDVVRTDLEGFDEYSQYLRLIGGDNGFSLIDNPEIEDGSSCVVTKESYANAFIPWLVNHYDKIYIADIRYNNMDLAGFIKENDIDDLIMINNIQLIGASSVVSSLENLLTPDRINR